MKITSVIGMLLIGIMLVSTFAFAILQSVNTPKSAKLPETNVVDYQLDFNLKDALVENGATFMTLEYNSMCENCVEQKSFLEQLAKELKEPVLYSDGKTVIYPIYLEETVDETVNLPKLSMISKWGNKELTNATQDEIFSALCELLTSPPAVCAVR